MPSERDNPDSDSPDEPLQSSTRWGPRSQFRIFALGETFDVEAYLDTASVPLQFDQIWYRDPPHIVNSGIEKSLGGDRLTIEDQERIASVFLEGHMRELIELARFPGVDAFILGLYYRVELYLGDTFLVVPDARLMSLALQIGVQTNYYVNPVPRSSFPPPY